MRTIPLKRNIFVFHFWKYRYWNCMLEELNKWKAKKNYESVQYDSQKWISLRRVHASEIQNGTKDLKTRLVAKGFQEENNAKSDSPTCSKQSLGLIFNVTSSMKRTVQSIDINILISNSPFYKVDLQKKPSKISWWTSWQSMVIKY